ncbi:hypothetical protein ACMTN4_00315 (plasmid) [Rhodococcus globerulus]|uniref:hypothetical protein n=1 Tax=Rhodococcus globerulus TaxID=33008 RepID=UPI0039EBD298
MITTSLSQNKYGDGAAQPALHWIGGRWVGSGSIDEARNPSTGDTLGHFDVGGVEQARAGIDAARAVFDGSD